MTSTPPHNSTTNSGAKYTRRAADADECEQLAAAEPSLTKSKNFDGKWYCSLTCHVINATPSALRKHLSGKKIAFAKTLLAKGEHEPVPEPDFEEDEEEEAEEEEEEMEASEEEQEAGGSGRAEAKTAAAATKEKGTKMKKKEKEKKASAAPPPKTPDEIKGKGAQRSHDASRPSRPKRARK